MNLKYFFTGITLLILALGQPARADEARQCDIAALAQADRGDSQLPSVRTRDAVFTCAGLAELIPAGYDQLERDLLFVRGDFLPGDEYLRRYQGLPPDRLRLLQSLVREYYSCRSGNRQP